MQHFENDRLPRIFILDCWRSNILRKFFRKLAKLVANITWLSIERRIKKIGLKPRKPLPPLAQPRHILFFLADVPLSERPIATLFPRVHWASAARSIQHRRTPTSQAHEKKKKERKEEVWLRSGSRTPLSEKRIAAKLKPAMNTCIRIFPATSDRIKLPINSRTKARMHPYVAGSRANERLLGSDNFFDNQTFLPHARAPFFF